MNDEQLKQVREEMKILAMTLAKELIGGLKEELKAEQQASLELMRKEFSVDVAEVSKKLGELEKILSASSFVNRVMDDTLPSTHPGSTNIVPSTTSSAVTTTTSISTTTVTTPGVTSSTLVSALPTCSSGANTCPLLLYANPGVPCPPVGYQLNPVNAPKSVSPTALDLSPVASSAQQFRLPNVPHLGSSGDQIATSVTSSAPAPHSGGNLICSLAPFDGTVSWSDYRIQFEIVARQNRWTDQEKADAMITQLRGNALSILSVFPYAHRIQYSELVALLEQRFGMDSYSCQVMFHGRTQGPKENFANFALELQRLATAAFPSCPSDVVDRMVALRFLEGLRDDELRTLVKVRGPKTIHEAISAAQELSVGVGTGRGSRIYLAQVPSSPKNRRRQRQSGSDRPLSETDAGGIPGSAVRPPASYNSFVPASLTDLNSSPSTSSGNFLSSAPRGMSR